MKSNNEFEKEISELKKALLVQQEKNRHLEKLLSFRGVNPEEGKIPAEIKGEVSEAVKSRLWSRISHEILTPMDAILGMTELVMDTKLTTKQRDCLEMINSSADRLFGVISDVIDYSELLEGKLRCDMTDFDLFDELQYDLYVAELSCKHKDLQFSARFAPNIPNYLNSDPARLRQVLNNILSNAIKYTQKGHVSVKVSLGGFDRKGRLLIKFTVEDTGEGIVPEALSTIFSSPMTTACTGGEEKYSEGGLGLVVSAKLVEQFGGEIGVWSEQGKGSSFWFTWPVINPVEMYMGELPTKIFDQVQDRSMVLQGAKVLLAEDEYINASITKTFLEQAGLKVTVVGNGREALELSGKDNYGVILMDVQMPVMDGIEATTLIREREKKSGTFTPIIALTAHAMYGDRERCLQAGMDDYLAKPLEKDQLVTMLAKYLTRKALVVGSDPLSQHSIMHPFVQRGWAVIIAETGRMAMYEASLAHFDMIIIDASLPVEDGRETVETIRKLEEFSGCRATILGVGFETEEDFRLYDDIAFDALFTRHTMEKEIQARV
ncbi:MAG: response regulator [Desulfopila sp.]|jgi:signal transduction histidine kinase/DNA-binding response OmpR family regulator|nr:response regulator [Desulfopila sp.]